MNNESWPSVREFDRERLPRRGDAPLDIGMDDEPDLSGDWVGQMTWPFGGGAHRPERGISIIHAAATSREMLRVLSKLVAQRCLLVGSRMEDDSHATLDALCDRVRVDLDHASPVRAMLPTSRVRAVVAAAVRATTTHPVAAFLASVASAPASPATRRAPSGIGSLSTFGSSGPCNCAARSCRSQRCSCCDISTTCAPTAAASAPARSRRTRLSCASSAWRSAVPDSMAAGKAGGHTKRARLPQLLADHLQPRSHSRLRGVAVQQELSGLRPSTDVRKAEETEDLPRVAALLLLATDQVTEQLGREQSDITVRAARSPSFVRTRLMAA
jgi:hypothetical protein